MPLTGARISCSTLAPIVSGDSIRWYVPGIGEPSASVAYRPGGMNRAATQTRRLTIARVVTALGNSNFHVRGWVCTLALAVGSDMITPDAWHAFQINHNSRSRGTVSQPATSDPASRFPRLTLSAGMRLRSRARARRRLRAHRAGDVPRLPQRRRERRPGRLVERRAARRPHRPDRRARRCIGRRAAGASYLDFPPSGLTYDAIRRLYRQD